MLFKHIGIVIASLLLVLGIPLWSTGWFYSLFSEAPDAISSASVILDKPSGNYQILINRAMHPDAEKLEEWATFFSGGDILYIFEDISCSVASSDPGGVDLAESFRSQLPENQMKVKKEDGTLLLSRADAGLFDIIIMSREFANAHHAETALKDSVLAIDFNSETENEAE